MSQMFSVIEDKIMFRKNMNIYCTRASNCVDQAGYLRNVEGMGILLLASFARLIVEVEVELVCIQLFNMCGNF